MAAAPSLPPSTPTLTPTATPVLHAKLNRSPGKIGILGFGVVFVIGMVYAGYHLLTDLAARIPGQWLMSCWGSRCWWRWDLSL